MLPAPWISRGAGSLVSAALHTYHWGRTPPGVGGVIPGGNMRGLKQYVGRRVLVSTSDGGAIGGVLVRARRGGVELRKASEMVRGAEISGILWIPAHAVLQVQVTGGDA